MMDAFYAKFKYALEDYDLSIAAEIILGIVICLIIYIIVISISSMRSKMSYKTEDTPVILSGLTDASYSREIKQDPNNKNSKTLLRSRNEKGIEYSYSMWFYIDAKTWDVHSSNSWRHVFHKGPKITDFPNDLEPHDILEIQSPGLWLHPSNNLLRLYVNTYSDTNEYVEISNLPIKKWVHLVYTQSNFTSKIYINGRLKTVHELLTLPRQNYYNLYLSQNDGFAGHLTTMQYFNYDLTYSQIIDITKTGPNLKVQTDNTTDENSNLSSNLPYLSNKWWIDDITLN